MKETTDGKRLLLQFKHGWGDCCQFAIVLKHLKHYLPDWHIAIEAPNGKHKFFQGIADASYELKQPFFWRDDYTQRPRQIKFLHPKPSEDFSFPNTKAFRCIKEEFGLEPIEDLFFYEFVGSTEPALKEPYSILQGCGHSGKDAKDLDEEEINALIARITQFEKCIFLDWEGGFWIEEGETHILGNVVNVPSDMLEIWNGKNHPEMADPAFVYRLLWNARTVYGIDSGITHLAAATDTPTFCFWTKHKPWECFDLASNVFHFYPIQQTPPYFETHYNQSCYDGRLIWNLWEQEYLKIEMCPHYIRDN